MDRTPSLPFVAVAALVSIVFLASALPVRAQSGQRAFGQVTVEPAVDLSKGNTVFLLTPDKSPFPSKANPVATAPLYLTTYPLSSTIPAGDLNCQPDNCDHVNVLPFPSPDYGVLGGSDPACADFNGGQPCSPLKGHDHLVGIARTHGDFNVAWHVWLVFFTHKAFEGGMINERITTLSQLEDLKTNGYVVVADTPITFNCSSTSEATYERGTPVVITYP